MTKLLRLSVRPLRAEPGPEPPDRAAAPVTYIRLLAADTIDRAIAEALEQKTVLARLLVFGRISGEKAKTAVIDR